MGIFLGLWGYDASSNQPPDGFLLAAVGNDPTLNVSYHRAQMIAATMAGKIVVAEDAQDGSVVGVALWFPPGITMFASEDQDRIAFQPFITKCPPSIQTWWNDHFLVEHPKSCQRMFGRNWFNNAWQLELLAIGPGHQGKGIGSALVRDGQQRIFKERKLIYLDTQKEQNVRALYLCSIGNPRRRNCISKHSRLGFISALASFSVVNTSSIVIAETFLCFA
ncbi:hypothetical protein BDN71DRAFT_1457133 [Pleurotus eryngii]|uniref:N-acetyltransferase domain-containing protein n=1 Tax=Pleurotus eryngii TaxID=5323 RepID=A0A9P5ZLG8_PLEER|nr:hypothetical protein BDN71DRAFT_1457133 [Pleurotus eryngii]